MADIQNPGQLAAAVAAFQQRATSDKSEAGAAARAAAQTKTDIHRLSAWVASMKFHPDHKAAVDLLLGPQEALVAACGEYGRAADEKAAAANRAMEMARIHIGFQAKKAVGGFYQNG